jgi:hypothetical protein
MGSCLTDVSRITVLGLLLVILGLQTIFFTLDFGHFSRNERPGKIAAAEGLIKGE